MAKIKRTYVQFVRPNAFKLAYGITKEEYNKLLEQQSNCCAVCKRHMVNFKNKLLVDKTDNNVKGLLCPVCLGNIQSMRSHASNVIEYLKGDENV